MNRKEVTITQDQLDDAVKNFLNKGGKVKVLPPQEVIVTYTIGKNSSYQPLEKQVDEIHEIRGDAA